MAHPFHPCHKLPAELSQMILDGLDLRDLINVWLSAFQPFATNAHEQLLRRRDEALSPLRIPADLVMEVLKQQQAVISGSTLLGLLHRSLRHHVAQSDFDIFVGNDRAEPILEFFLLHDFQVTQTLNLPDSTLDYDDGPARHIKSVTTLTRAGEHPIRVDIVESDTDSPLSTICRFHSTPVRSS